MASKPPVVQLRNGQVWVPKGTERRAVITGEGPVGTVNLQWFCEDDGENPTGLPFRLSAAALHCDWELEGPRRDIVQKQVWRRRSDGVEARVVSKHSNVVHVARPLGGGGIEHFDVKPNTLRADWEPVGFGAIAVKKELDMNEQFRVGQKRSLDGHVITIIAKRVGKVDGIPRQGWAFIRDDLPVPQKEGWMSSRDLAVLSYAVPRPAPPPEAAFAVACGQIWNVKHLAVSRVIGVVPLDGGDWKILLRPTACAAATFEWETTASHLRSEGTLVEAQELATSDPEGCRQAQTDAAAEAQALGAKPRKHGHYFRGVAHLQEIDIYRFLDLFGVTDQALGHAIKKLVVPGMRGGGKPAAKDIQEAVDTLLRKLEMLAEDAGVETAAPLSALIRDEDGSVSVRSPDGFKTWDGSLDDGPVRPIHAAVDLVFRDGTCSDACNASHYSWRHRGLPDDIVAYRVTDADPHAELRKTWAAGQRWQFSMEPGEWIDMHSESLGWHEPTWHSKWEYRRHPDDARPWYPDDSGWVELPSNATERLNLTDFPEPKQMLEVMTYQNRRDKDWSSCPKPRAFWDFAARKDGEFTIAAYKVVPSV